MMSGQFTGFRCFMRLCLWLSSLLLVANAYAASSLEIIEVPSTGQTEDTEEVKDQESGLGVIIPTVNENFRLLREEAEENEDDISTNTANVSTNTTDISTNTTNIANQGIKAWVNFDGTAVTGDNDMTGVNDSYNVSGVVDNGTGDYTIYWETDFANTNYAVAGMAQKVATVGVDSIATGSVTIEIWDVGTNKLDGNPICLIAIGDQ